MVYAISISRPVVTGVRHRREMRAAMLYGHLKLCSSDGPEKSNVITTRPSIPFDDRPAATGLKMKKCLNVIAHGVVLVVRRVDNNSAYLHIQNPRQFMWPGVMSLIYVGNLVDFTDDGGGSRSRNLLQGSLSRCVLALQ
jgi:hypothetical protein